jgi:hypothetical protein
MTAATLRQTAAAEAIEKKAIHMVPSSYRRFESIGLREILAGKPLTNARPDRGFLVELRFAVPKISFCRK